MRDKAMTVEDGVALRKKMVGEGLPLPTWTNYRKTMTGFKWTCNNWLDGPKVPIGRIAFVKKLHRMAIALRVCFEIVRGADLSGVTLRVYSLPKVCFLCSNIGNHLEAFAKPTPCPECGKMPPYTMGEDKNANE